MADASLIFDTKIDSDGFVKGLKGLSSKTIDLKNKIHDTEAQIKSMTHELEKMAKTPFKSDAAKNLEKEIAKVQEKLRETDDQLSSMMSQRVESNMSLGFSQNEAIKASETSLSADKQYQKLSQAAELYDAKLQTLQADLEKVRRAESGISGADTAEYEEKRQRLVSLGAQLESYKSKLYETEQAEKTATSQMKSASSSTNKYKTNISAAGTALKSFHSKLNSAVSKTKASAGKTVKNFFTGIVSGARGSSKSMNILNKITNTISRSFKRLFLTGVLLKGLQSVFSDITEGFGDIAKLSPSVNHDLSELSSSFSFLKKSISAAVIPALQAATPYLTYMMDALSGIINRVGQLVSLITGKSIYAQAIKQQKDYAASLDDSSKSLSQNTKAAEENQRGLAGFDELNVLSESSENSSDNGSSSTSPYINTEAATEGVFDQIKEAIKSHDFNEIGQILGDKINDLLSKFKWGSIKSKSKNWGINLASLFNGLIKKTDWSSVGKTAAEGFNTVIAFMLGFSYEFDWKKFGKSIKESLVSFFKNLDKKSLIDAFDELINGIVEVGLELVGDPDEWEQWGSDLEDDLKSAIEGINWENVKQLFWNLLKGVFSFSDGFFGSMFDDLDKELDGKDFKGIGNKLAEDLKSVDWEETVGKESTIGKGIAVLGKAVIAGLDFIIGFLEEPGTADSISEGVSTLLDNVPWADLLIKGLTALFDATAWITDTATELVNDFSEGLATGFSNMEDNPELKRALLNMLRALGNLAISFGETYLNSIFVWIPNLILGWFKSIVWTISQGMGAILGEDWLNDVNNKLGGFYDFHVDAIHLQRFENMTPSHRGSSGRIPAYATGTVVPASFGEYLAVMGDNKREPEVVSPLSTMKQALAEVLAEAGGSKEIHLTLNLDRRAVFDEMVSVNGEYIKSHGYSAFAKG